MEDQVLLAVSSALRRQHLLAKPDPCYAYTFDPSPGQAAYTVDVKENHRSPQCGGGDPETQPRLFTVHVEKKSRLLSSDAHTPGDFQPISP